MEFPAEFSQRIYKTRLGLLFNDLKKINETIKDWQGSYTDVVYEGTDLRPRIVIVFETAEDCTAFTLIHGRKYV